MAEKKEDQEVFIPYTEEWKALSVPGVFIRTLRRFPDGGSTVMVKMEQNSSFPLHDHQDGEETVVLKGEVKIGKYHLKQGDFLYVEPGTLHAAHSKEGCLLLSTTRKPLDFIRR